MDDFREMLGRFEVTDNGDGTRNVTGVPIFQTGSFKSKSGDVFDADWFEKARQTHEELKREDGYLPPIFVGHTREGEEKEAKGFFDNLRLEGKRIIADLVKIPADFFDKLKRGAFPARSVEAIAKGDTARLLGLAMLGSSTPACKFGPLHAAEHFNGNVEDVEAFEYKDDSEVEAIKGRITKLEEIKMADEITTEEGTEEAVEEVTENTVEDGVAEESEEVETVDTASETTLVDKINDNEVVKMEEKVREMEAKFADVSARLDKAETEKRETEIDAFIESENAKGHLPKSVIQFDGEADGAALRNLLLKCGDDIVEDIKALATAKGVVAHMSERAVSGDEVEVDTPEAESVALAQKAKKYSEDNDVDYKTALIAVS